MSSGSKQRAIRIPSHRLNVRIPLPLINAAKEKIRKENKGKVRREWKTLTCLVKEALELYVGEIDETPQF